MMINGKAKCLIAVLILGTICSCTKSRVEPAGFVNVWPEDAADIQLEVEWSLPMFDLSRTTTLEFLKWPETDKLIPGPILLGQIVDWHGAGSMSWSLSDSVLTNGVKVIFKCHWRDSVMSGETNTSFFVPFHEERRGGANGFVYHAKWIKREVPNQASQTIGSEASPQSGR